MKLEVVTPSQFLGDIIGDLNSRRAHVESVETRDESSTVHAQIPLAESFGYSTSIRSATQGRATYSMEFDHYQPLPTALVAQVTEQEKVGIKGHA